MSGLILKLGPKERILVNGAVIENGERRSRLAIMTPDANILRLRDVIHPEDAKTPVKRACYAVQLVLSGDATANETKHALLRNIEELRANCLVVSQLVPLLLHQLKKIKISN